MPRQALQQEQIIQTAIALLDDGGIENRACADSPVAPASPPRHSTGTSGADTICFCWPPTQSGGRRPSPALTTSNGGRRSWPWPTTCARCSRVTPGSWPPWRFTRSTVRAGIAMPNVPRDPPRPACVLRAAVDSRRHRSPARRPCL